MASRDWSDLDGDPDDRGGDIRSGPGVTAKTKKKLRGLSLGKWMSGSKKKDYEKTKSLPAKSRRSSVASRWNYGSGLTMDSRPLILLILQLEAEHFSMFTSEYHLQVTV